jgi:parvulin-like peptidyl-prolyl isomerase
MPLNRRIVPVLLFTVLAMLLSSCGSTPTETPVAPTATPEPSPSPLAAASPAATAAGPSKLEAALSHIQRIEGTPLARVDGQEITWQDYEPSLRQALLMVDRQYNINWDDAAMQTRLYQLQNDVLQQAVDHVLLRKLAAEQGLAVSDEQMKTQIDKETSDIMGGGQYADWDTFLKENGLTQETFEQVIRDTLLYTIVLGAQKVETQDDQVHLAHIVVGDEATIQEVHDKLQAGEDFGALAAQYSLDDQTKGNGGDLGWFTHDLLAPEIEQVAFSLEPGQYSDPITTQRGYAIIKILERGMHELEQPALQQRQQAAVASLIEAERGKSQIEILVDFTATQSQP